MSYCRWSSDNWKSDVYVYADVAGGYTIHVAGNRVVGDVPEEPDITADMTEAEMVAWVAAHRRAMEFMMTCERKPIDLPHAGKTFREASSGACINRLAELRKIGYRVPQYAIDALVEEAAETDPDNPPLTAEQLAKMKRRDPR